MADGQLVAGGIKRDRINVFEKYELRDWAICLDTPASAIEEAVRAVGDQVDTVVSYLEERSRPA
jgi:hypothetical protein